MISDRIIGLHSVLLPLFKRLLSNKPPCLGFHSIKHTPRASQIIHHTSRVQVYFSWVTQSLTHKNPQKVKIFPGGVLLGIIGGVCDPVLQILTLFWTKKCIFSYPSSDLASEIHTRFQTWRLRNYFIITLIGTRTKRISRSHVSLSTSFGIETMNTFIFSYEFSPEPYPVPYPNGQSLYPFSDQNGARTLPFGVAHTYNAYIREYPLGIFTLP